MKHVEVMSPTESRHQATTQQLRLDLVSALRCLSTADVRSLAEELSRMPHRFDESHERTRFQAMTQQ